MSSHELKTTFSLPRKEDAEIVITYNYTAGSRAVGPSYYHGGLPAEPPEVEVIGVLVNGKTASAKEFDLIVESDKLYEQMVDAAEQEE